MIIQCESCSTRFKVADDKVTPRGIKVRCSKCQHVFTVKPGDGDVGAASPTESKPRPSGIFAAVPQSGQVPAGLDGELPHQEQAAFDPFQAPADQSQPVPSPPAAPALSFDDDVPPPPPAPELATAAAPSAYESASLGDAGSLFASPGHTIGAPEEEEEAAREGAFGGNVATTPPSPAGNPFQTEPPGPSSDPFAAPPHDFSAADPFQPTSAAAQPAGGDPFSSAVDPFGGSSAPAAADPFAPGADPFMAPAPRPPPMPPPAPPEALAPGDDPFDGLGVEVDDAYVAAEEPAPEPVAPPPPPPDTQVAEARVKAAAPKPVAKEKPKRAPFRLRIPPSVPRAAWMASQAVILVGFLTLAVVWARGGSAADIKEGRAGDVVLGRVAPASSSAPLRAEDVVVQRRPVGAAADLVLVSGYVVNDGPADVAAVRVEVRFGEAHASAAWAGAQVSAFDLEEAPDLEALKQLAARVPEELTVPVGQRAPFLVLVQGPPDGARADVKVRSASPPEVVEGEGGASPKPTKARREKKGRKRGRPAADVDG